MSVYIHHIDTLVPDTSYKQDFIRDLMKANVNDRRETRLIHRIYSNSGIDKRHSVIKDFNLNGYPPLFFNEKGTALRPPSTKERNETYIREAKPMFCSLAEKTINNSSGYEKDDITHVITVSCTGFFAPGPDFYIVNELGLKPSTQRFHLGFMGCYAAFTALKMADAFCKADPDAVVLIVCLELCTLHLQLRDEPDYIISASVFADGAGSALVSARKPAGYCPALSIQNLGSDITPTGEHDMAWNIGDTGFDMTLSTYVPDIIKANISTIIDGQLKEVVFKNNDIHYWAVHPGGRAILDKIQNGIELTDEQLSSSRNILSKYGNMSSATILFVLKDVINNIQLGELPANILAMAFGPGLTVETGIFQAVNFKLDEKYETAENNSQKNS